MRIRELIGEARRHFRKDDLSSILAVVFCVLCALFLAVMAAAPQLFGYGAYSEMRVLGALLSLGLFAIAKNHLEYVVTRIMRPRKIEEKYRSSK